MGFAGTTLGAQDTTRTRADTVAPTLERAVVSARWEAAVVGGSAAVRLRADSLRLGPSANLDELLRTIPLMLVRQNSRGEVELSSRGAESRQVGILMDGLPLSYGWDGRADVSLIPISGVTAVTFTRGLGTLLAGTNTLGGVVELQLDEQVRRAGWESRLALGSDQTAARQSSASTATSRQLANGSTLTVRGGGSYRQRDGFTLADGVADVRDDESLRIGTDLEQHDGFAHASWRAVNGASLGATATMYSASRGVAPELHLQEPRYWRYPDASRSAIIVKVSAPRLFSGAGITQLDASIGRVAGTTRIEQFGSAAYDAVVGTEAGDETTLTGRVQLRQTLPNGASITAAASTGRTRYFESLNASPALVYRQQLSSVGAETMWPLGSRTIVAGGVVADVASTPEAGGRIPQGDQRSLGWRLGGTTRFAPGVAVHASASRRARFPALRELYSGSLNRFEPNPLLRPEQLLVTEAGVTLGDSQQLRGWSLQATGFVQSLSDGIVRVSTPERKFRRVNQNAQRSTGVETLLDWRGGVNGPSLLLDMVAQRVRITDVSGSAGPQKPEHQPGFRAGVDATLPVGWGMSAGTNIARVGAQYCVHAERGQNVPLAAQTSAGVTLERGWALPGLKAFRWLRVLGAVDNVANVAMYEQCGLPRAGRTARVSIELR